MKISRLRLNNWRNFREADLKLQRRLFVVGPNASGKSNLLDALRFLRDIADPEGGFQRAVKSRGGVTQLRCLHARRYPNIAIEVSIELDEIDWMYRLEFAQDNQRRPLVKKEEVERSGKEFSMFHWNPESAATHADRLNLCLSTLSQIAADLGG